MPSSPILQACANTTSPRCVRCWLNCTPGRDPRSRLASVCLAHLERLAPQVVAVELQEIEGDENDVLVVAAMPQHLKARHPVLIAAHRLAIDQAAARLQLVHGLDDERVAGRPVMPVPGQQPDADRHGIAPRHQPIAVVLDLMHPVRPDRRSLARGWQAGLDEAGERHATPFRHTNSRPKLTGQAVRNSPRSDTHALCTPALASSTVYCASSRHPDQNVAGRYSFQIINQTRRTLHAHAQTRRSCSTHGLLTRTSCRCSRHGAVIHPTCRQWGKISATRDENNGGQIEPAELRRVYPVQAAETSRTDELIAELRARLEDMRHALATATANAETWRAAFEREQTQRALPAPSTNAQRLALPAPKPAETPAADAPPPSRLRHTWRWLRSTG